jgi:hypothetical protein
MNTSADGFFGDRWPMARMMILILAGAFGGLMMDIRVEHVEVVHEQSVAWLPIIYAGIMAVACGISFVCWGRRARMVIMLLSLAAIAVGGLGFYFHNQGNITKIIKDQATAWIDPQMKHPEGPPQTAPLAFSGLGVIGVLASMKKFNTQAE